MTREISNECAFGNNSRPHYKGSAASLFWMLISEESTATLLTNTWYGSWVLFQYKEYFRVWGFVLYLYHGSETILSIIEGQHYYTETTPTIFHLDFG